jgi:integrase
MRGSVLKRGNRYSIVYDAGRNWDVENGSWTRNQKWEKVPHPNTKKHAESLLAERLTQLNRGEYLEPSVITFAEFQDIWMKKYAIGEGQIRASTINLYDGHFRNHLIPSFGSIQLSNIGVEDIQGFKAEKTASGLSAQTVKHLLRLLRQMLDHAIDWGYLRENPAKKVRNPKVPRKEMDFLTAQEVGTFLNQVPNKWYPFFLTAIVSGLRIGELFAMKWSNLDWNRGQYFVRETWLRPRGGHPSSIAEPKTETSAAPVDLTPTCLQVLREHRHQQTEGRFRTGEDYEDMDLIFATPKGTPLDPWNVTKRVFNPALKAAGLRRIRFHDLRHTCTSLLIAQGESPKYIQTQLRHASVEITFDRYGHLFPNTNREAAKRLDETLFGKRIGLSRTV